MKGKLTLFALLLVLLTEVSKAEVWIPRLVSHSESSDAISGDARSVILDVSSDGRWVLLWSRATNLLTGQVDTNGMDDIFLHDRNTNSTILVSRALGSPTTTPNAISRSASMSADGNRVLYSTDATNILAGVSDANNASDLYLFDRTAGTTTLVSRALGSSATTANAESRGLLSADGRWAVFSTAATNVLGISDTNNKSDVFALDVDTGATILVSRSAANGSQTANNGSEGVRVSADGRWILVSTWATNLVSGMTDNSLSVDLYLFDRIARSSTLVSRQGGSALATPSSASLALDLSPDARWVLFYSHATDVIGGQSDSNSEYDVFLFDRDTASTTLISRAYDSTTTTANGSTYSGRMSADGRWIAFTSSASNLISGLTDNNGTTDAYLFDRTNGSVLLVSRYLGTPSATPDQSSSAGLPSANGEWLTFESSDPFVMNGVADANGTQDGFLFHIPTGTTSLVSRALGSPTTTADSQSSGGRLSADGNVVVFNSNATNLVPGVTDANAALDAFVLARHFEITTNASQGGILLPNGTIAVVPGTVQAFTVTSDTGYSVASVTGCGGTWTGSNPYLTAPIDGDCVVDATFVIKTYQLSYVAGANGSLSGAALQSVTHGADGEPVAAVPTIGYRFSHWSDGSTANPRIDADVTADLNTTALFAANQYTLSFDSHGGTQVEPMTVDYGTTVSIPPGPSKTGHSFVAWNASPDGSGTAYAPGSTFPMPAGDLTLHAIWLINTYTLSYNAGANGSLTGNLSQSVQHGGTGTAVIAVADAFHHFVGWSDGVTSNPRVDTNVTKNTAAVANFTIDQYTITPVIGPGGSTIPATAQLVNHGAVTQFTVVPSTGYRIASASGCGGMLQGNQFLIAAVTSDCTLHVTFNRNPVSTNSVVQALEDGGTVGGTMNATDEEPLVFSVQSFPSKGALTVTNVLTGAFSYAPANNQNGPDTFTFIANDGGGNSGVATVTIEIAAVNDRPDVGFAPSPSHPAATSGTQSVPGFATMDAGPADEDVSQSASIYLITGVSDPDGVLVNGGVSIAQNGTLTYDLSGVGGTATVTAVVRDTGGVSNGGIDLSLPRQFTIDVAPGADLQIGKTNHRSGLLDGESVVYSIVVANAGPNEALGAVVTDEMPATLVAASWACLQGASTAPCPVPAGGNGNLSASVNLGPGEHLRFDVMATVSGQEGAFVINTAMVAAPAEITAIDTSNDSATDQDPIVGIGIFLDGFEHSPANNLSLPSAAEAMLGP